MRVWAGLALVLCLAPAIHAQDATEEARAAADAGSSEYDLGHYTDALAHFEKAYRLRHVPALLFNIAQCHRMLGQMGEAATVYRSFLARDPQNPRVEQVRGILQQVEAAVSRQSEAKNAPPTDLPQRPEAEPPGPVLVVQAPAAKDAPSQAPAAPATAAPPLPARASGAGEARLDSSDGASQEAFPSSRPVPAPPPGRPRVATWIAGGAAVIALGTGAAFGLRSRSEAGSLRDTVHSRAEVGSLQDGQAGDARKANALYAVGGALAAAAAAFFVLEW